MGADFPSMMGREFMRSGLRKRKMGLQHATPATASNPNDAGSGTSEQNPLATAFWRRPRASSITGFSRRLAGRFFVYFCAFPKKSSPARSKRK